MDNKELKKIRTEILKISQEKLAEEIGMTRTMIGYMERDLCPIEKRTELAVRYLVIKNGN